MSNENQRLVIDYCRY